MALADCIAEGTTAYQDEGPQAALPLFEKQMKTQACAKDPILKLNYARTLQAVGRAQRDDMLLCLAAEAYISVQGATQTPDAVKDLAGDGATELLDHCAGLPPDAQGNAYTDALNAARSAGHERAYALATLIYKAAVRIDRTRMEAHRSLCKLLRRRGDKFSGAAHCEAWRTIITETHPPEVHTETSTRLPWILTGLAGASFIGGFAAYILAADASDDAFAANARARATDDISTYTAADNDQKRAVEKLEDLQATSWVLFGVGAAFTGVAAYYWFSNTDAYVLFGPGNIQFNASF